MRKNYDFSGAWKNPYAAILKEPGKVRLEMATKAFFEELADSSGVPAEKLIALYLQDCAVVDREREPR